MTATATLPKTPEAPKIDPIEYSYDELKALSPEAYAKYWDAWHAQREAQLNSEYGWLSLRSIDWLEDGKSVRIPNFPGAWTQSGDTVVYTPQPGKDVYNRGQVLRSPKVIEVSIHADVNVEDFDFNGVRAQLIKRIGPNRQFAVRQRDPQSLTRAKFAGVPHFEPNQDWIYPARYEALNTWANVETAAVLGDLSHNETQIGTLYVTIDGKEYGLVVFQGHNDDSGWTRRNPTTGKEEYLDNRQNTEGSGFILFRDATSGKETYGGARGLHVDIRDPKAVTYADFNQATNLPCAFTYYCTCPFAPRENLFPFAVRAGETTPTIVDAGDFE
ncbi:MAG: DUF1684 domain-containing protein [Bifidobacteriaceae bacterium]|jgi:uncharacterized protein (DUF1684 family)|nr:DUF1684 domain-containing protein [Bifidobacteriaceae bacterium]